jgi:hypothetical protein
VKLTHASTRIHELCKRDALGWLRVPDRSMIPGKPASHRVRLAQRSDRLEPVGPMEPERLHGLHREKLIRLFRRSRKPRNTKSKVHEVTLIPIARDRLLVGKSLNRASRAILLASARQ